jgi:branched-subunit amino acid transport protein
MEKEFIILVVGMALATYIPRMLPLVVLTRTGLPPLALRWLSFIPVAVLSALLFPGIFLRDGALFISWHNIYLLAAIPTIAVAWKTRNLFLTIIVGIVVTFLLKTLVF